jgi:ethanolaminephosphotransferase
MVASFLLMLVYAPNLDDALSPDGTENFSIPRWVFLFNGLAMLFYQTLDNMDGKQARRTGSSSPLGMLFDHGCDALNSPMGSINWAVAMAINPAKHPIIIFWCLISSAIPFYIATWEEYYTGALILPIINGPSEGLLLGASLSIVSFFAGPQFWHTTTFFDSVIGILEPSAAAAGQSELLTSGLTKFVPLIFAVDVPKNYQLVIFAAACCAIQEFVLKTISVVSKFGFKALLNLLPFVTILVAYPFWCVAEPELLGTYPRTMMILFGTLFVEMTCALMMDHMTLKDFNPIRLVVFPLVLFPILHLMPAFLEGRGIAMPSVLAMLPIWGPSFQDSANYLFAYVGLAVMFLTFKSTIQINEITEVLGIWCFNITKKRDEVHLVKISKKLDDKEKRN